ncbi:hypothetical protein CFP56_029417 [Quercus suber]|uniref:Uncharacterized protein n=1 Tax=Quercus suber TaxID=58331 RepID=A0AAW0JSB3_QUESU
MDCQYQISHDDIGDLSHPKIVMEQEELSDLDEEIKEHVEFECEEMADSEGEDGSGCEQIPNMQNKVTQVFLLRNEKHSSFLISVFDLPLISDPLLICVFGSLPFGDCEKRVGPA